MKNFTRKLIIGIIVLFTTPYLTAQTNGGLIAYYDFNNNSLDVSGQNNHGIVNGASLTTDRFGNLNSAYLFDGFNDNIEIQTYANMSPTEGVTISAWIKTTSSSGSPVIYERLETNMGFGLRLNNLGQLVLSINGGEAEVVSQDVLTTDKWYHVAGTYDLASGELKLYIYGNLIANTLYGNEIDYTIEPRNSIGAYGASNPGAYFNGAIDEVRIYDKALSETEVDDLFTSETFQSPGQHVNLLDNNQQYTILTQKINILGQQNTSQFLQILKYDNGSLLINSIIK
jgi:hypothetical protein